MQANVLHGVGVAVCDEKYHAVIIPPRGAPRDFSGVVLPGQTVIHTIEKYILPRVGFTTRAIGISYHNSEALDEVALPDEVRLQAVSPTVATLAGLKLLGDKSQVLIHRGPPNTGWPEALLKIGPRTTSWALDTDIRTHRFVHPSIIAGYSPRIAEFIGFVGAPAQENSIELLGNFGWLNAARFVESTRSGGYLTPDVRTSAMLQEAAQHPSDRQLRRRVVSRLCSLAKSGDPFSVEVGRLMSELIGRTIAYVAAQEQISSLAIQANSISAIDNMPEWTLGEGGMFKYIPTGITTRFIGPRPQVLEAYGAIKLASILALMAA